MTVTATTRQPHLGRPRTLSDIPARAVLAVIALIVAVAVLATTLMSGATARAPRFAPGQHMSFTASQQKQWAELTSTPARRAEVLGVLQRSFAGVAKVGIGGDPHGDQATTATTETATVRAANYNGGARTQQAVAVGMSDHLWATASYADVISGGIWTAQQICGRYLPGWICSSLANVLRWLASGYTYWTGSHGVWGAAYWSGYVTGGRW